MTKKISELTAGAAVADAHLFESSQGALSTKVTATQLKTYFLAGFTAAGLAMGGAASAAAQTALLSNFIGDSGAGGTKGLVPAPAAGDAAAGRFLKADGTWSVPAGGGATQAFGTISVAGQSDIVADAAPDTLTIVAGANVTLTTNATTDTLTIAAAGGSGSPGGSDTQVQFNDGGVFGGDAGLTYNKTTNALSLVGTTSTNTGLLVNAASGATGLLIDTQLNGASRFQVSSDGLAKFFNASGGIWIDTPNAFATYVLQAGATTLRVLNSGLNVWQKITTGAVGIENGGVLNWGQFGGELVVATLSRQADGVIQFGTTGANASGAYLAAKGTIGGNSALSAPAWTATGTWITGGSATTTKPHVLIEPTGATSTGWDTAGTGLGVNAASGFTGRLMDLQTNGVSRVRAVGDGRIVINGAAGLTGFWFDIQDNGVSVMSVSPAGGSARLSVGSEITSGGYIVSGFQFLLRTNASGASYTAGASDDTHFSRASAGVWNVGTSATNALGTMNMANLTATGTVSLAATTVAAATATPAAGSTAARLVFGTTAGFGIYYGSGAPTVSAAQGSVYLRSDGGGVGDRLYVNTNGSTTWTNFVSAA